MTLNRVLAASGFSGGGSRWAPSLELIVDALGGTEGVSGDDAPLCLLVIVGAFYYMAIAARKCRM